MASTNESPWQAIISAALLGTERQPFQPPIVSGKLGDIITHLSHKPTEAALLLTAGTIALHQRVGWLPGTHPASSLETSASEDLPRCSSSASRCLQQIIQGQYSQLLTEWLDLAAMAQQRIPELCLPAILDKGRQQRELRAAILPVLGQRGRWLAAQNPDWSYAVAFATETDWETGTSASRVLVLQDLRSQSPEKARALLQSTWSQETASDRSKFLETLRTSLSLDDESFLEQALSDRSKEVRRVATDLLSGLPNSRLCQQVKEYTCRYFRVEQSKDFSLQVQLPEQFDEAWTQLGIEAKPSPTIHSKLGEKAWWLLQLIGATPLHVWTEQWQLSPQEIINLTPSGEWQMLLLNGFALAAKRQSNDAWLEAIFKLYFAGHASITDPAVINLSVEDLFHTLSGDRRDALLIDLLRLPDGKINNPLIIWLLRYSSQQWSLDLARLVLEQLDIYLNEKRTFSNFEWELKAILKEFARFIPISLTSEVINLRNRLNFDYSWIQSIDEFLSLLQFRQDMARAFDLGIEVEKI